MEKKKAVEGELGDEAFTQPDNYNIVFDYVPREFPQLVTEEAENFVRGFSGKAGDFKVDDTSAQQSGVSDLNQQQIEDMVEEYALEKLKQVEEKAYQEAHRLGIIEGTESAFKEARVDLSERLDRLDSMLQTLETLKERLIAENEESIMTLVNLIASKIALKEIESDPEIILKVIQVFVGEAQEGERTTVKLATDDMVFLTSARERMEKPLELLNRIKLDSSDNITPGGCLIETQFGTIDATVEQRLGRVWSAIEAKIPRTREEMEGLSIEKKVISAEDGVDESAPSDPNHEETGPEEEGTEDSRKKDDKDDKE